MQDRQQKGAASVSTRLPAETHARFQLIGACILCRLRSGCEDSIAQDWRSITDKGSLASVAEDSESRGIR